jgi:hypothetical protein
MAYKFDPVISTYVDPKSIEISKTLNDRYAQNFAVNDALNTAMRDMQFAPFENDTALAKELRQSTDAKLQQIAQRGDYENMTFPLHSIAKETGNMMKPLAENYQRYQGTVADLSKRLEKGDVNAEQYDLYKGYMTRGYKGLELDEYGRAKTGTAFSAPTLYNDPKIMDRVTKRLEILHTQETGNTTSSVQRDPATGDLVSIDQGGSITQIDPKLVQKAVDAVMQESDVKMYLDQMGTMKTYKYSDAVGGPDKLIEMQATNLQDKLGQLNAELNSGKYRGNDKLQIQNSINSVQNELNSIGQLTTPDQKLNYAKNSFIQEYEQPIREYASLKGGIYKQTSMYKVDNLSARERDKQTIEFDLKNPNMYSLGNVNATQFGGKDTKEKLANINSKQNEIATIQAELKNGYGIDVNGNKVALSDSAIADRTNAIERLQSEIQITDAQVKQAARNSISYSDLEKQDPTLIKALSEQFKTKDPGELYVKLQQIFENTVDQDYLNFKAFFDNKYGANAWSKHNSEYYEKTEQVFTGGQGSGERAGSAGAYFAGVSPAPTQVIYTSPKDIFTPKFENKINKGLLEVKTSTAFLMDKVPGLTPKESMAFTNKMNNLVLNKPVMVGGVYTDDSGNEIPTENLNGYKVIHYGSDTAGSNLIRFDLVSDAAGSTPKTVYMNRSQLTNQGIEQVYNTNSYKLASRMLQAGNVGTYTLDLNLVNPKTGQNAGKFKLKFNDVNGNGKPLVTIADSNGKNVPKEWFTQYKLPPVVGAINPNSELFTDFINLDIVKVN